MKKTVNKIVAAARRAVAPADEITKRAAPQSAADLGRSYLTAHRAFVASRLGTMMSQHKAEAQTLIDSIDALLKVKE